MAENSTSTPLRHGRCKERSLSYFRFEVAHLFNRLPGALRHDVSHRLLDASVLTERKLHYLQTFALREHLVRMIERLLHSLDRLQLGLKTISFLWESDQYSTIGRPELNPEKLYLDTTLAGDAVLHYVAAILEDVARILPFSDPATFDLAWHESASKRRCDSFSAAISLTKPGGRLERFRFLFEELKDQDSWWALGFAFGSGSRQRIVHYTDWTSIGVAPIPPERFETDADGWGPIDSEPSGAWMYLTRPGEDSAIDFIPRLRFILTGMCKWLDEVESCLKKAWIPDDLEGKAPWLIEPAPLFLLPVVGALDPSRKLARGDDFYLPSVPHPTMPRSRKAKLRSTARLPRRGP